MARRRGGYGVWGERKHCLGFLLLAGPRPSRPVGGHSRPAQGEARNGEGDHPAARAQRGSWGHPLRAETDGRQTPDAGLHGAAARLKKAKHAGNAAPFPPGPRERGANGRRLGLCGSEEGACDGAYDGWLICAGRRGGTRRIDGEPVGLQRRGDGGGSLGVALRGYREVGEADDGETLLKGHVGLMPQVGAAWVRGEGGGRSLRVWVFRYRR